MGEFKMPLLGADMEAGTLVEWSVKQGDAVQRGDIIAVVETQKGAIEIESFETGRIQELRVRPGEKVPVGTVLALITAADAAPASATAPVESPPSPTPIPAAPAPIAPESPVWIRSSPTARRRAQELGFDLATLTGTGPHGAITRADVERGTPVAPASPPAAPASRPAAVGMRMAIAAAMERSNREIPHYYLKHTIDLHHALGVLAGFNAQRKVEARVLPAALLLQAVARCLPRFMELNGAWAAEGFGPATSVNLGVAVSLRGGGLVVPTLHDADKLDLAALMAGLQDIVARARAGRLRASDLSDSTITVTNLGDQGVESVYGVIYPGQAAIIGIGKVVQRPWAVDNMLAIRPVVHATLAGDHRASDGHRGAQFLAAVDHYLQEVQLP